MVQTNKALQCPKRAPFREARLIVVSQVRRVLRAIGWLAPRAGRLLWRGVHLIWTHLLDPALCVLCITAGAFLTTLLPASLWAWQPLAAAALSPVSFPLASFPDATIALRAGVSAFALAIRVFATGAYNDWSRSEAPLLARMLYACHAGLIWPRTWFRRRGPPT